MRAAFLSVSILLGFALLSCQGPWSYWPEESEQYQGVWAYAFVVAGRPLTEIYIEREYGLSEQNFYGLPFYREAEVRVTGPFSGSSGDGFAAKDTSVLLVPADTSQNQFLGPPDLLAQAGATYTFEARLVWDSAGVQTTSLLSATTTIPQSFHIERAYATYPGLDGTGTQTLPYAEGSSVPYAPPPFDLLSHYFVPSYDKNIGGVVVSQVFGDSSFWPETTLDRIAGQFVSDSTLDTARHAVFGDRSVRVVVRNRQFSDMNKVLDSISLPAMMMPIGKSRLLFYATTPEFFDYRSTFEGGINPREAPQYNVEGGAGIFAGMLVDTFEVNLTLADIPGMEVRVYPNEVAKALACAQEDYDTETPRWEARKECREYLSVWCGKGHTAFDADSTQNYCDSWIAKETPQTDEELRVFCADRNWQVKAYPACEKLLGGLFKN